MSGTRGSNPENIPGGGAAFSDMQLDEGNTRVEVLAPVDAVDWEAARQSLSDTAIGVRYLPMWDIRRQVISTFVAQPVLPTSQGLAIGWRGVLAADAAATQLSLDHTMLAKAAEDLNALLGNGMRSLVCLQVQYETLASAGTRLDYAEKVRRLPENCRQHLIIELLSLPPGMPATRLIDITGDLKQLVRSIIAQAPAKTSPFAMLRDAGIRVCGLELTGRLPDETQAIHVLGEFAAAAQQAKMETYIHGTPSLSLVVAMLAAGFSYISGSPVASPAEGLQMVQRYGLDDLYSRMLRGLS